MGNLLCCISSAERHKAPPHVLEEDLSTCASKWSKNGRSAAHSWLAALGLPQYAAAFHSAGYDDIDLLAVLEEKDLDGICRHANVDILPGHRKKILLASKQMGQTRSSRASIRTPGSSLTSGHVLHANRVSPLHPLVDGSAPHVARSSSFPMVRSPGSEAAAGAGVCSTRTRLARSSDVGQAPALISGTATPRLASQTTCPPSQRNSGAAPSAAAGAPSVGTASAAGGDGSESSQTFYTASQYEDASGPRSRFASRRRSHPISDIMTDVDAQAQGVYSPSQLPGVAPDPSRRGCGAGAQERSTPTGGSPRRPGMGQSRSLQDLTTLEKRLGSGTLPVSPPDAAKPSTGPSPRAGHAHMQPAGSPIKAHAQAPDDSPRSQQSTDAPGRSPRRAAPPLLPIGSARAVPRSAGPGSYGSDHSPHAPAMPRKSDSGDVHPPSSAPAGRPGHQHRQQQQQPPLQSPSSIPAQSAHHRPTPGLSRAVGGVERAAATPVQGPAPAVWDQNSALCIRGLGYVAQPPSGSSPPAIAGPLQMVGSLQTWQSPMAGSPARSPRGSGTGAVVAAIASAVHSLPTIGAGFRSTGSAGPESDGSYSSSLGGPIATSSRPGSAALDTYNSSPLSYHHPPSRDTSRSSITQDSGKSRLNPNHSAATAGRAAGHPVSALSKQALMNRRPSSGPSASASTPHGHRVSGGGMKQTAPAMPAWEEPSGPGAPPAAAGSAAAGGASPTSPVSPGRTLRSSRSTSNLAAGLVNNLMGGLASRASSSKSLLSGQPPHNAAGAGGSAAGGGTPLVVLGPHQGAEQAPAAAWAQFTTGTLAGEGSPGGEGAGAAGPPSGVQQPQQSSPRHQQSLQRQTSWQQQSLQRSVSGSYPIPIANQQPNSVGFLGGSPQHPLLGSPAASMRLSTANVSRRASTTMLPDSSIEFLSIQQAYKSDAPSSSGVVSLVGLPQGTRMSASGVTEDSSGVDQLHVPVGSSSLLHPSMVVGEEEGGQQQQQHTPRSAKARAVSRAIGPGLQPPAATASAGAAAAGVVSSSAPAGFSNLQPSLGQSVNSSSEVVMASLAAGISDQRGLFGLPGISTSAAAAASVPRLPLAMRQSSTVSTPPSAKSLQSFSGPATPRTPRPVTVLTPQKSAQQMLQRVQSMLKQLSSLGSSGAASAADSPQQQQQQQRLHATMDTKRRELEELHTELVARLDSLTRSFAPAGGEAPGGKARHSGSRKSGRSSNGSSGGPGSQPQVVVSATGGPQAVSSASLLDPTSAIAEVEARIQAKLKELTVLTEQVSPILDTAPAAEPTGAAASAGQQPLQVQPMHAARGPGSGTPAASMQPVLARKRSFDEAGAAAVPPLAADDATGVVASVLATSHYAASAEVPKKWGAQIMQVLAARKRQNTSGRAASAGGASAAAARALLRHGRVVHSMHGDGVQKDLMDIEHTINARIQYLSHSHGK